MNVPSLRFIPLLFTFSLLSKFPSAANDYVEPGSLRLSHELTFENILHRLRPGWKVNEDGLNKTYFVEGEAERPWKGDWGERLLTEVATRLTPEIFGRVLFEAQVDYADWFWRPINIEHDAREKNHPFLLRQAEGKVDKENWYIHGFSGVGHVGWEVDGDFFSLYPTAIPDDDYLGRSTYFGIYPNNWKQDVFLNISRRHVPLGGEAGLTHPGFDAAVAYGTELAWGYKNSGYGRVGTALGSSKLSFVYKDEDVPYGVDQMNDERNRAYALSWMVPSEEGHRLEAGVLYQPFRTGRQYQVARDVSGGAGLLGSSVQISEKTAGKKDGFAERLRMERHTLLWDRIFVWSADLTHADILAGNKNQVDLQLGTDVTSYVQGNIKYTYRKPSEGPIPFLFEGSPDNIGAVAANPRGPESPFSVNWENREAVFLVTTLTFDPNPGTRMFLYDPSALAVWNLNPKKISPLCFSVQHRMSDYRTTTDRQYYYDKEGEIVWEPAAHSGAWATDHPLQEIRLLAHGNRGIFGWTLGVAGGQSTAQSSLAYSNNTVSNKPITEYIAFEGQFEYGEWGGWGHFGSGVWGPEPYQAFLGESLDRLFGLGLSYKIAPNTTVDLSYLGARQDDELFVSPDLGSYDEIRTLFSHRFGFLFQFQEGS